jgi:class 3 adenylate cyclase/predicted ATPase
MAARVATDGERKTITALFADLKGSTALIEGLDPEEARAIIDPALQLMMDAVHRYEGYVAQALGDGIFALFGAPIAHEDHPQRALYAALRMQEEMRRYGDQIRLKHGVPLAMRVGVNTGEVVVRSIRKDDLHTDYVPVGHSTNLAARMEQMATPGSILVTAYTQKLAEGYFAFKALGQTQIKGVEEPLNIYEVLGAGPLRTRLQVSARRGLTRFVGRQSEMEQLQRALAQAKEGHGQIVGTMGEPGLGKSRLFYEFKLLSVGGCLVLEAHSVSHGKATAYLPVIELLKSYFRIEPPDDERTRREKVAGKVVILDRTLEEILPYLYALLGIEEQPSLLAQMDPQIRRRRTFEALKKLFLRESLNQPLILIFEDLHWIDGETQGFLDVLSESVASARLLLLTNYRPEYRHEWGQKTYYTQLRLAPFGKAEAEEFLGELLGIRSSPQPSPQRGEGDSPRPIGERARVRGMDNDLQPLKQLILDKTQGTPFFMEEIVQELVEQGVLVRGPAEVGAALRGRPQEGTHIGVPLQGLHIPPTVQGVLAARIDRLTPAEKALLQQLAVIGREFPLSLVQQVIPQPEDELYRLLSSLQHKEFLYEQPAFPESEYLFKHALTQEVAYNSVLIERRKVLHEQTAQAIEYLYHDRLEERYSELAHHYSRSGNTEKAIEYLHKSGQQAAQRSANEEAINHLTAALEQVALLPDTPARAQRELALLVALGVPMQATKGFAAPEVEQTYTRARALCQQMEESSQLFTVLRGLWGYYHVRAQHHTAYELGKRMLFLAHHDQDSSLRLEAHHVLGASAHSLGQFTAAQEHFEHGITLYDHQHHRTLAFLYGYNTGTACLGRTGINLWILGYPDRSRERCRQALALAREVPDPHSLAAVLDMVGIVYQFCGDRQTTQTYTNELATLASEHDFGQFSALAGIRQGWLLGELGQYETGLTQMRHGLAAWQATGAERSQPYLLCFVAEAYRKIQRAAEGIATVDAALALVNKNDERFHEAELYRLKGELTLQQWKVESQKSQVPSPQHLTPNTRAEVEREAEECFLKAIEIARKQQAKSLELRATMSLVRLRQQQAVEQGAGSKEQGARTTQHETRARLDEARHMLSDLYHWFTEGFDTADLRDARALVDELMQ